MNAAMLHAGPLAMWFDPQTAALRGIRLGGEEIVRSIYGAVRDRNWDTVEPRLSNVRIDRGDDRFEVTFDAQCQEGEIDFVWHGRIAGQPDGTVTFRFDGQARRPFLKNRIGLCVLHPATLAGRRCRIEHVDGSCTEGAFPQSIAPHQPLLDIRAIEHRLSSGANASQSAEVRLEGETFEMEDQRNWTDGSFKTYSTPLARPFPVSIEAGQRIVHTVTIRLRGAVPAVSRREAGDEPIVVSVDWHAARPKPPLGLGLATAGQPLSDQAAARLRALQLDHLRIDLQLATAPWRERLAEAIDAASRCGCRLHLALHCSQQAEAELEELARELAAARPPVSMWLVYRAGAKATDPALADLARERLAVIDATIPLAAGTDHWFAELNRNRPPAGSPAWPCFSITPQVHASDKRSIVETLEAQRSTIDTARQFSPHPVVVSTITLRPRANPNATDPAAAQQPQSDARQSSPFAAAWTLGTLAQLATHPHVGSLTFYETAGERGILSESGQPWPLYELFAALAQAGQLAPTSVDQPLSVAALGLVAADGRRSLLVGNLTEQRQTAACRWEGWTQTVDLGPEVCKVLTA